MCIELLVSFQMYSLYCLKTLVVLWRSYLFLISFSLRMLCLRKLKLLELIFKLIDTHKVIHKHLWQFYITSGQNMYQPSITLVMSYLQLILNVNFRYLHKKLCCFSWISLNLYPWKFGTCLIRISELVNGQ